MGMRLSKKRTATTVVSIALDRLQCNGDTQMRAKLDDDVVRDLMDAYERGDKIPPLIAFQDAREAIWLADGFHRLDARQSLCGDEKSRFFRNPRITVEIRPGTQEDAQWHAVAANNRHGKLLTQSEKTKAIRVALLNKNADGLTDQQIAKHLNVTERTVRSHRCKLVKSGDLRQETSASEKAAKALADPKNIGKSNRQIAKETGVGVATVSRAGSVPNRKPSGLEHSEMKLPSLGSSVSTPIDDSASDTECNNPDEWHDLTISINEMLIAKPTAVVAAWLENAVSTLRRKDRL